MYLTFLFDNMISPFQTSMLEDAHIPFSVELSMFLKSSVELVRFLDYLLLQEPVVAEVAESALKDMVCKCYF